MKNFRVLITSRSFGKVSSEPIEFLKRNNCAVTIKPGPYSDSELAKMIEPYHALIVGVDVVGKKTLSRGKRLKVIAEHGAGVDNICVEEATKKAIVVTRVPYANSEAVAELTFALMLGIARNLLKANLSLREGLWEGEKFMGVELCNKTLGIVGLGAIGQKVAKKALGFDMKVLYYDVVRRKSLEEKYGIEFRDLHNLLSESDFVSLHVPLTKSTHHLLSKNEFSVIKKGAYLINTSRGEILNETDLYEALKRGHLAGAALDVYSQEPPGKNFKLLGLENVFATPHIGGYTVEANKRMGMIAAEEVIRSLTSLTPKFSVNLSEIIGKKSSNL